MSEPPRIQRYDLVPYQAAFVTLDAEVDGVLLGVIEDYAYATSEDCWIINIDFVLGALQEEGITPTPGEQALLLLCQQAKRDQYTDVLVYMN